MIRTLIVEDDPMVMQINERFLSKIKGYEHVGSVNDIQSAKEMVKVEKPDLLLLDIFFSVGRGIDIIQWLREENIDTDVIFITADRNPKTIESFSFWCCRLPCETLSL
ncbi:response regulator [Fusibacter sp. JL216-2]|uniref:response regulator n=1 Tax=Fusibacter sp. JL216-2 TaxID=3071453 RepID=UPI003D335511